MGEGAGGARGRRAPRYPAPTPLARRPRGDDPPRAPGPLVRRRGGCRGMAGPSRPGPARSPPHEPGAADGGRAGEGGGWGLVAWDPGGGMGPMGGGETREARVWTLSLSTSHSYPHTGPTRPHSPSLRLPVLRPPPLRRRVWPFSPPPPPAGGPPVTRAGSRLVMRRVPGALTHVRPPSLVLPQA